jgi:hypothetical protein
LTKILPTCAPFSPLPRAATDSTFAKRHHAARRGSVFLASPLLGCRRHEHQASPRSASSFGAFLSEERAGFAQINPRAMSVLFEETQEIQAVQTWTSIRAICETILSPTTSMFAAARDVGAS